MKDLRTMLIDLQYRVMILENLLEDMALLAEHQTKVSQKRVWEILGESRDSRAYEPKPGDLDQDTRIKRWRARAAASTFLDINPAARSFD